FSEMFIGEDAEQEKEMHFGACDEARDGTSRQEEVELALQTLPPAQRVPLVLYHFDGLAYDEIAERLKISMGKVKTDIFRGRESLKKKLRLTLD
ncbi:MAG: RNA polymerase sigma factor, partial [Verrucomicrobiota bacterium]